MAKKPTPTKAAPMSDDAPTTIIAFKGFDRNLQCRGFRYQIGATYEHPGKVVACPDPVEAARGDGGFHACEHPLNVFDYYAPAASRYAEVTLAGTMARHDGDTKIAAAKITINVELSIGDLVKRAWDYTWSRAKIEEGGHATGYQGAASATGYQGAASATGDQGAASATGYQGAAMASGYEGRASGKDGNAIFLAERDDDLNIVAVWAGIVGRDGIKADVFYMLRDGQPVEVS